MLLILPVAMVVGALLIARGAIWLATYWIGKWAEWAITVAGLPVIGWGAANPLQDCLQPDLCIGGAGALEYTGILICLFVGAIVLVIAA